MLEAVAITLLAAAGNNIGKALQKQATLALPRLELEFRIIKQYLRNPTYLIGMGVDIAGALLMIVAFAKAPVSVVQPVASAGLAALAVFSHFYLEERLAAMEWLAVVLAALGTVGLGLTAEDQGGGGIDASRALITLGFCLLCMGGLSMHSLRNSHGRSSSLHPGHEATGTAVLMGLQAGGAFGMSAACCRTGLMLAQQHLLAAPCGLGASVGLTSLGFAIQTKGLKDGKTVVVCTCAAVSSMVTEAQVLQGASYGSILMGVAMLSGAGGMGADPYASKLCAAVMWGEDGWYQGLLLPEAEEDVIPNLGTWTWHWSEGENGGAALYRARARSFAGI